MSQVLQMDTILEIDHEVRVRVLLADRLTLRRLEVQQTSF
jgi:hypothetical protein